MIQDYSKEREDGVNPRFCVADYWMGIWIMRNADPTVRVVPSRLRGESMRPGLGSSAGHQTLQLLVFGR